MRNSASTFHFPMISGVFHPNSIDIPQEILVTTVKTADSLSFVLGKHSAQTPYAL
ncbi:hypothetical protein QFZ77_001494 [Paenibacillus sp. V4I3]|nr:hypothetical protein [Paenibacillus sp. V4I3]